MKLGKFIALLGLIFMTLGLIYAFMYGDFFEDGGKLLRNPWGIMSMIDLYVGFTLFSMWIFFREKNLLVKIIWIIAMMILGFFTGALYIIYAFYSSKDDWLKFFLGHKKESILKNTKEW